MAPFDGWTDEQRDALVLSARQLCQRHWFETRFIEAAIDKAVPEATGEDRAILAELLRDMCRDLHNTMPKEITFGHKVWSTIRAIARQLESTGSHGKALGGTFRRKYKDRQSLDAVFRAFAGSCPEWLYLAAGAVWHDVVLANPAGVMRCYLDNVAALALSDLEGATAVMCDAKLAKVDVPRLPKAAWCKGARFYWALVRWLVSANRRQVMTGTPEPHVISAGTWKATAAAVLGRTATESEAKMIRFGAQRIAACDFEAGYSLDTDGDLVRRGGKLFDLDGSTFTLAPGLRHYARRTVMKRLGGKVWKRNAKPDQVRAVALVPVSGLPMGVLFDSTEGEVTWLQVHAEILSNAFQAMREGVDLVSTGDFTAFDVQIREGIPTPFCSRAAMASETLPAFVETLRAKGLIMRVDTSGMFDPFDPFDLEDRPAPRRLPDGSMSVWVDGPTRSQLYAVGNWTAADAHSEHWLTAYRDRQAKAIHAAMLTAGNGVREPRVQNRFPTLCQ